MINEKSLVTVTGASGFIAMHCIAKLLNEGYEVMGTLRSLEQSESIKNTIAHYADVSGLSFVEADLMSDVGWDSATVGSEYVLHIASPVPRGIPKNDDELILPARDGTLRVLKASQKSGVKRVVMTSSTAAVLYGHKGGGTEIYDESYWSDLSKNIGVYKKGKTLAEKVAWEYVNDLPEDGLELVTLNLGLVLGPLLGKMPATSSAGGVVRELLNGDVSACPDIMWAMVDVRDVVSAHLAAIKTHEAAGQRFLIANEEDSSLLEIAKILEKHYSDKGYSICTKSIPKWLILLAAIFSKQARLLLPDIGKRQNINNSKAKEILGYKTRSLKDMVLSMAESMIKYKMVN